MSGIKDLREGSIRHRVVETQSDGEQKEFWFDTRAQALAYVRDSTSTYIAVYDCWDNLIVEDEGH